MKNPTMLTSAHIKGIEVLEEWLSIEVHKPSSEFLQKYAFANVKCRLIHILEEGCYSTSDGDMLNQMNTARLKPTLNIFPSDGDYLSV